ncbi:hypothetical protein ACETAC_02710 [Aceticella autotrophica]|uniref:Transposase n=1 Tax=Aceticella autotrophica TaxID=2755338 RepID=A0A975GAT9_9THEO|nr:hypothetical protein [Aceticella autotrophica]QSZ27819.1 hypothetical protein ACETAC_02710 [Aceticella autotrophica]
MVSIDGDPEIYQIFIEKCIRKGEEKEKLKTAMKLLKTDMSIDKIMEITELPLEKIKNLTN